MMTFESPDQNCNHVGYGRYTNRSLLGTSINVVWDHCAIRKQSENESKKIKHEVAPTVNLQNTRELIKYITKQGAKTLKCWVCSQKAINPDIVSEDNAKLVWTQRTLFMWLVAG